jgi:hypothetical protein
MRLVLCSIAIGSIGLSGVAAAAEYEIATGSAYDYSVPQRGPGIPGCQPDNFHCAFAAAGTLEFEVDLVAGHGTFVAADLQLAGNEMTSDGHPDTRAAVAESLLLTLGQIPLESSSGGGLLFREPVPPPTEFRVNSIEVLISGNQLRLSGAYDQSPIDGPRHAFDVVATAAPEPATLSMMIAGLAAVVHLSRRQRTRRRYKDRFGAPT